jgi:hypothetical protein
VLLARHVPTQLALLSDAFISFPLTHNITLIWFWDDAGGALNRTLPVMKDDDKDKSDQRESG